MRAANRPGVSPSKRQRACRPALGRLEDRCLLAINLNNVGAEIAPPVYGVGEFGQVSAGGVGWSVVEVGDVNADGFNDFVAGAPSLQTGGGFPIVGGGQNSAVYLVFGSAQVNAGNFDFRLLNPTPAGNDASLPNQRGGDLAGLGNPIQTNPGTNQPSFAFNGLRFILGQNQNGALGASVAAAGDVNGDGIPDFLIGAPGATDVNNVNTNTGRAYLVYGSPNLSSRLFKTVDLDDTTGANSDLAIMTFTNLGNASLGARTGTSVAGVGDWITDGFNDIAIGAPGASITGLANQGAVYVVSGAFLRPARSITVALNTVGQGGATNTPGFILAGSVSGDNTGFSVAGAGDTTGQTTGANQAIHDLLIGAPDVSPTGVFYGTGSAYLVYGGLPATLQQSVSVINGAAVIPLSGVGSTVPGAVFNGDNIGDATGYSVSTAGDFNGDGRADYLIGSPSWDGPNGTNSGRDTLIFGQPPASLLFGSFDIGNLAVSSVSYIEFQGAAPGALTGFSSTATAQINDDAFNEIAIGAPGINGGSGQVYLIPGNPELFGPQNLAAAESLPIQGLIISNSFPGTNFLGASVSGNLFLNGSGRTVDNDSVGDLIIGAPGFSLNSSRNAAGVVYALEGAFLPLPNIVSTAIQATIGIDQPFPPFQINATQPADMAIYVFSNATISPPFIPLQDIDPTTVTVNGVSFPDATIVADPIDENGDGLQDAIITITPRSALALRSGTQTITLNARTLPSSPNANRLVAGSAQVTVTGGGSGGGGLPSNRNALLGIGNPNLAVPDFGGRLIPNPAILRRLNWRPRLNQLRAYRQFLPKPYFAGRFRRFYHGPNDPNVLPRSRFDDAGYRTTTLGRDVFTRSKYPTSGVIDARRVHKYGPFAKR